MAWMLRSPIFIAVLALVVAVALLLALHFLLRRWPSHTAAQTVTTTVAVALVMSVFLAPMFTHVWATIREDEQRRWGARLAHFERLRPVLRENAKQMMDASSRVAAEGHVFGLNSEDTAKDETGLWFPNVLSRDLRQHFVEFSEKREEVRRALEMQHAEMRELVGYVARELRVPQEVDRIWPGVRSEVGHALFRGCIGKGAQGIRLVIRPDGYSYIHLEGFQSNAGPPPANLVAAAEAFRTFQPDRTFTEACERLSSRASTLERDFSILGEQAKALAETAVLKGDCPYLMME